MKHGLLLGAMLVSGTLWAQPVVLKFASFEPLQAPFTARVFATWAEDVPNASNGALTIEMFAGGTLGRNPLQQLKLIQDGVADIAWTIPGYTPGRFDDTEVVELPFLVKRFAAVADAQITAVPEAIEKRGKNTIVHPDPATQDAFKKALQPVRDEWRKARPRNERVYQAFAEELGRVRAGK